MKIPQTVKEINRNNKNRRADQFYVIFYGIPENISNLFGKQIKSIDRPSINFGTADISRRSNRYTDMQEVRFDTINAVMYEDEDGLTSEALFTQIYRQINRGRDIFGRWQKEDDQKFRFDIGINLYNSNEEITESYILNNCFISTIEFDQLDVSDDEKETEIRLGISFNNINYSVVDDYVETSDAVSLPMIRDREGNGV